MNNSIAAIILTYNEEKHISCCINSLKNICEEIFVIDSFSKDRTVEIAKEAGAQVYQNPWKNYATQFNWGLKNCPITTEWIWRIDADEFLEGNLGPAMKKALAECNNEVNGVYTVSIESDSGVTSIKIKIGRASCRERVLRLV